MPQESEAPASPIASILGVLVLISLIVFVAVALFFGGSSVATEPTPIFGSYFPVVIIFFIVIFGIVFLSLASRLPKESSNDRKSHT